MLAIVSAGAIAICMDSRRLKAVHLDLALISAVVIAQDFTAESDGFVVELNDFSVEDFIFFEKLFPLFQDRGGEVLSQFPEVQHIRFTRLV